MKRFFKRFWLRVRISVRNYTSKQDRELRSVDELQCLIFSRKTIKDLNSELLVCPVTGKRYVKNTKLQEYIIISQNNVDLINHNHLYNVPICNHSHDKLIRVFDGCVSKRREAMETDIRTNVEFSLNKIFNRINF